MTKTIVRRVGRLMEFRYPAFVEMEFIKRWAADCKELMGAINAEGHRTLAIGDLRPCHVMSREVTDAIVAILKVHNPLAERTAVLFGNSVFGLQVWRIFQDSNSDHRTVTNSVEDAVGALRSVATPEELARARAFLAEPAPAT